jgi:geranylgeranyl pyrophosphate synthase
MDIYQSTIQYLSNLPIFEKWPDMLTNVKRMAAKKPCDWQLPVLACQAVGKPDEIALPATAALACMQIGIILVDDMLDSDPSGEYRRIGNGRAANFALAFQAAGMDGILKSQASIEVQKEAIFSLSRMMAQTAFGQDLDIQNPVDEESYWRVVKNKSAPFYGCVVHLGALFGMANWKTINGLEQFGKLYGEMIQIHDDLNDTMAVPANPDWLQCRKPLPILFALSVDHPKRARFIELFQDISRDGTLQEAQEILIRCGAVSYCVDQLIQKHQSAKEGLYNIPLTNHAPMDSLLDEVIAPINGLLEALER